MNRRVLAYLAGFACVAILGWASGQVLILRQTNADETLADVKPSAKPCDIAMIDIGKVFKNHVEFKRVMDALKADFESVQEKAGKEQLKLEELRGGARSLKTGTEARRLEEARLEGLANELEIEFETKRKEIMEEEARAYYRIFKDIKEKTAAYAKSKRIRAVIRYNSDSIDPDDHNSVLQGVNNSVVFQDNLDITDEIIRCVNNVPAKR